MDTKTGTTASLEGNTTHLFSFNGNAREYFGIWIVNILLTIVTFGIYSAWAKVRRNRYFYGNTELAGRTFDYHAKPMQILIGRIIVLVLLGVYNILLIVNPVAGLVALVIFLLLIPWMVMRGLRFGARVTSYRNVRFDFTGGYGGAFLAFIVGGFVSALSAGLLAPFASRWSMRYLFDNLRYGGKEFRCDPPLGKLYGAWMIPALMTVFGLILLGLVFAASYGAFESLMAEQDFSDPENPPLALLAVVYLLTFSLLLVYGVANLVYSAGARNVGYNATVFDGRHNLLSDVPRWRYAWVAISNVVVTVLSLGLMRPWAAVRMAHFMAQHTALDVTGDFGTVLSDIRDEGSATGSEFMDVEGFDVGF